MKILTDTEYKDIRELYILYFTTILPNECCNYLWDHLREYNRKSEQFYMNYLMNKNNVYIMWDTLEHIELLKNDYFKYPRHSILSATTREFYDMIEILPEDIYVFDDSFTWTVVFTNEYISKDRRYCLAII